MDPRRRRRGGAAPRAPTWCGRRASLGVYCNKHSSEERRFTHARSLAKLLDARTFGFGLGGSGVESLFGRGRGYAPSAPRGYARITPLLAMKLFILNTRAVAVATSHMSSRWTLRDTRACHALTPWPSRFLSFFWLIVRVKASGEGKGSPCGAEGIRQRRFGRRRLVASTVCTHF